MAIDKPLHPGVIVKETIINGDTGLSITRAAELLDVGRSTLHRLFKGESGISPEMALRLSIFLGTSAEMWMNLQRDYDLWQIEKMHNKLNVKPIDDVA